MDIMKRAGGTCGEVLVKYYVVIQEMDQRGLLVYCLRPSWKMEVL